MTDTVIQPYLFFSGRCEEALAFYDKAIGAKTEFMMRFSESPDAPPPGTVPEGFENKIMHASLRVGSSVIMASDGCDPSVGFQGFSLSLSVRSADEADRAFAALSEGGSVTMPLGETFWSPRFGMLTDKFGVGWLVSVVSEQQGR